MDKSNKLTLRTLTLNKERVKKERENIAGGQECRSFQVLRRGRGGGNGLDEISIFPFSLKNEETNVLGMEETRFKTDHSQHGPND